MAKLIELDFPSVYIASLNLDADKSNYGMPSIGIVLDVDTAAKMANEGWRVVNRPKRDSLEDRWVLFANLDYKWWGPDPFVYTVNESGIATPYSEPHIRAIKGIQYGEPCAITIYGWKNPETNEITARVKELRLNVRAKAAGIYIESSKPDNAQARGPIAYPNFDGSKMDKRSGRPITKKNGKPHRDFAIVIQDMDLVQQMVDDGWNIYEKPVSNKEGALVEYMTFVNLDYDGFEPPTVTVHRPNNTTVTFTEDDVAYLQRMRFSKAIATIRGSRNRDGQPYKYKGYVQSLELWMESPKFGGDVQWASEESPVENEDALPFD